jgi:hypothetical protein
MSGDQSITRGQVRSLAAEHGWDWIAGGQYHDTHKYTERDGAEPVYLYVTYDGAGEDACVTDDARAIVPAKGDILGFGSTDLVAQVLAHWMTTKEFIDENSWYDQHAVVANGSGD